MRTPGNCADERPVPHWLCRLHRDARLSAAGRDHGCDGVVLPLDRSPQFSPERAGTVPFALRRDRPVCRTLGLLGPIGRIYLGDRSVRPAAVLGLRRASAFEEGRGRPHRSHRRLSLGDPALCGGALLPAAAAVAAGQSGRKSSVRPGMPCRIRRRARRLPRSRRRAVAHRRCQHSLRAAVPRRGCPRVAFGHVPSHRRRPFGGRSTLLRALPRTVGLVAASEHQGPDGGGNRRRPNPRSASFSLRHGPRRHRHARCGPRRCLYRAQRRKRAAHRHGQPGCPVEGRLGPPAGGAPRRRGRHPQRRRPLRLAPGARGCGAGCGALGARGPSRLRLPGLRRADGGSGGGGTGRRPRRALLG